MYKIQVITQSPWYTCEKIGCSHIFRKKWTAKMSVRFLAWALSMFGNVHPECAIIWKVYKV